MAAELGGGAFFYMKQRHDHKSDEHNSEPCPCPSCRWLEQQIDSIDANKGTEILREVAMKPAACNAAVGLVLGLCNAAVSMGWEPPETVQELLQVLAVVRLEVEENGKFMFEKP